MEVMQESELQVGHASEHAYDPIVIKCAADLPTHQTAILRHGKGPTVYSIDQTPPPSLPPSPPRHRQIPWLLSTRL